MTDFKGFYKLSTEARNSYLIHNGKINQTPPKLPQVLADQMIENVLGQYSLPLGLAVNFSINDKEYLIPMAVEEPSVVAAASNGAKILGNIQSKMIHKEIIGQIIMYDVQEPEKLVERLKDQASDLMAIANNVAENMVRRGGGPRKLWFEIKNHHDQNFVTCYLSFDPCNAMGANAINNVLERLAIEIEERSDEKVLMSILSNYSLDAIASASVSVPFSALDTNPIIGEDIARKIQVASQYAMVDPFRATTHNKGIMNGVDAVLMATGNDWRAVEVAVHAYASRTGTYQPLSQWQAVDNQLVGEIHLPLPVATVGGTLSNHPTVAWTQDLLGRPSALELAEIIAAVGLAQNFSALKALVTDGIQKGHMRMQARSLAIQVGAEIEEVPQLVSLLTREKTINSTLAKEFLETIRSNNEFG